MNSFMKATAVCFASLVLFALPAKAAGDPKSLAVKPGEQKASGALSVKTGDPATAPARAEGGRANTGFEEFSSLNDPLFREGSKAMLQKAGDENNSSKNAVKGSGIKRDPMRDAPADTPSKAILPAKHKNGDAGKTPAIRVKTNKLIKVVPADPVNPKSTL